MLLDYVNCAGISLHGEKIIFRAALVAPSALNECNQKLFLSKAKISNNSRRISLALV
jgi:hypothetical protein